MKKTKIVVTGGAGFIASHIVDRYIENGHEVLVIDDLSTGNNKNLNASATFIKADIRSLKAQEVILDFQPDVINHHAAQIDVRKSVQDPRNDASINIIGLLALLQTTEKLKQLKKFIFASTGGAVYGETDTIPTPEDYPAFPASPYGIAKLSSEHYIRYYHELFGFNFICLRYGNVYGPRQNPHGEAGVVAIFAKTLLDGKTPVIHGDGNQTRDFIFVGDVVDVNQVALEKNLSGIFNIGTEKETNVNQIAQAVQSALGIEKELVHGPAKTGEQKRSCLDCRLAKNVLDWKSSTKLAEGIKQTVEFFKDQ